MEYPPQDLRFPVNLVNVDEGQGSHIGTWRLVRTTQNPEVERSQVKRQENAQSSDSWKQYNQEEASHSARTRKLLQAGISKHEVHEPSVNDKYLPFSAKGVGNYSSTFALETFKTNVLMWRKFRSSSMKAAIHLGPNYLSNLEVYKNTNFEEINSEFIQ